MKNKTHYYPVLVVNDPHGEDRPEKVYCGTVLGEKSDFTNHLTLVNCKKCINKYRFQSLLKELK